jgi:hypothetical protein
VAYYVVPISPATSATIMMPRDRPQAHSGVAIRSMRLMRWVRSATLRT